MTIGQAWQLLKESVAAWIDDYASSMGAALAYYTVFSIAPLLLIVIAVAGFFFGSAAAEQAIASELEGLVGHDAAIAVRGLLESASSPSGSVISALAGLGVLLIGATTVFAELQDALDRIWRAPAAAQRSGLWSLIRARLLSFGMILGIGFLLTVSLVVSALLAALGKWWGDWLVGWQTVFQGIDFVLSLALVTVIFALIYKVMPRVNVRWHDVWIGAGVTALLFTVGKILIGLYLGRSGIESAFGAAGSLIVLLAWVYYAAQIFLLGAEFTWVYAHRYGSRQGESLARAGVIPSRRDVEG